MRGMFGQRHHRQGHHTADFCWGTVLIAKDIIRPTFVVMTAVVISRTATSELLQVFYSWGHVEDSERYGQIQVHMRAKTRELSCHAID